MALWLFTYKKTAGCEDIYSAVVRAPSEKKAKELFSKEKYLNQSDTYSQKFDDFEVERLAVSGDTEVVCTETRLV